MKLFLNILFSTLITSVFYLHACTPIPLSFCDVAMDSYPENPVFLATVVGEGEDWRDIKIARVIRGEENREVIRIWDGPDQWCSGIWLMLAADYGYLGDTIVCTATLSVVGELAPINDYFHSSVLGGKVRMKVVNGLLQEVFTNYFVPIQEVLDNPNWEPCPGLAQSVDENYDEQISIFPNPATDFVQLECMISNQIQIGIYSLEGLLLKEETILPAERIDISQLPKGILMMRVLMENGDLFYRRILRQ